MRTTRRQFVQGAGMVGLGLALGCGRWPWQAQPQQVGRIGVLTPWSAETVSSPSGAWAIFRQRLRELGYVEGQNAVIEWRV